MPKTVTLADLRTEVRLKGDFDNSRVITDARLDIVINDGVAAVWDELLRARKDYYVTMQSATTTPGVDTVALATTFYRLRKVEWQEGGEWRRLLPVDLTATNRYQREAVPCRYRLQGSNLVLVPAPTQALNLRIWYLPYYSTLVADGDTFDGISGHEELVVAEAIYRLKLREGLPVVEWLDLIARQRARLKSEAADWDTTEPHYFNPSGYDSEGA